LGRLVRHNFGTFEEWELRHIGLSPEATKVDWETNVIGFNSSAIGKKKQDERVTQSNGIVGLERRVSYSYLKATIGSARMARRAGK